jgi:BMFP domain-containing protein YqiC
MQQLEARIQQLEAQLAAVGLSKSPEPLSQP